MFIYSLLFRRRRLAARRSSRFESIFGIVGFSIMLRLVLAGDSTSIAPMMPVTLGMLLALVLLFLIAVCVADVLGWLPDPHARK